MSNRQVAILLMILSTLSFSVMQLIVKVSSGSIPTMEQVFARNLLTLLLALVLIIKDKAPAFGKRGNRVALIGRSLCGFIGVVGYFYATNNMDVADASMLHRSSPFFTILFAAIFLKDKLKKIHLIALILGFLGALMVIKPSFDLSALLPVVVGLISAAGAGAAYVFINYIKGKESNATIIFMFSLVSCVLSLAMGVSSFIMPQGMDWILLLGIGLFAGFGQMALTQAFKMASPGEVSIINYLGIIFSAILGFVFLNEIISLKSFIGMIMIFSAASLLYFWKNNPKVKNG